MSNPGDAGDRRPGGSDQGGSTDGEAATRRDIERLEAELERKERQLRRVTDRYELLLREKNRQLADRDESTPGRETEPTLRSVIAQYVRGRP